MFQRLGRTKILIILVLAVMALLACRFAWAERGYLKELRLMADHDRFWTPPATHAEETSAALGPYYISSQGPYALRYGLEKWELKPLETPTVLEVEEARLDEPWEPPLVQYADGPHVNPITVAQVGLADYTRYLYTNDARFLDATVDAAEWLRDNQAGDGSWPHDFPHRDLEPGWISAMAQGQATSLLLRAYQETGDATLLDSARRGIDLMLEPLDDGGTLGELEDATPMLEEYVNSTRIPHVFNGAVFALFGLHDFALVSGDSNAARSFEDLSGALATRLDAWDTGSWTRYALSEEYAHATVPYHLLHTAQASVMFRITGDDRWKEASDRWASYAEEVESRGTAAYAVREFAQRIRTRIVYSSWWPWSPLQDSRLPTGRNEVLHGT